MQNSTLLKSSLHVAGTVAFVSVAPLSWAQNNGALPSVIVIAVPYDADDERAKNVRTATKTPLALKDIPQTVESLDVTKYKNYGSNDLSVILDGVPGVDTRYDMRGDGISIRGFDASNGDIYRDGVRESGQVRRSTANIERIEILKGPAAVLYGRGAGGGVVNLISKEASFEAVSSVNLRAGSWENAGTTLDINRIINPNVAVRLTLDKEQAHSFRRGIKNRNQMVSPSILLDNHQGLRWLAQYTNDNVWRVPDRGPAYNNLPNGVSIRNGFAHPDDYAEDKLQVLRSDLSYQLNSDWSLRWLSSWRKASQDFDHLYGGSYCDLNGKLSNGAACNFPGKIRQNYAWQQTSNKNTSQTFDLSGKWLTAGIAHDVLLGLEYSEEKRHPRLATGGYAPIVDPFNPGDWGNKPIQGKPTQHNAHKVDAQALYFQDLISLTQAWKVLVGARYDSFKFSSTNLLNAQHRAYKGNNVSPRIGLIWQPTEAHSVYTSYSKNFSPYGGRGLLGVSVSPTATFDAEPQYSRQYEVGLKSDWLEGRLSSQIALYDLENYNIRYQPDAVNQPELWEVRGKERSRGMELSMSGRIARSWYLRGGVGLQSAKIIEDARILASVGQNKIGNAKRNGAINVRYAPGTQWYGELGTTYRSAQPLTMPNTVDLPGYTRWDALMGWRVAPWNVTLAFTNITNKAYWRSSSMPGTPRALLLKGTYIF